jgi:hypothetical protein
MRRNSASFSREALIQMRVEVLLHPYVFVAFEAAV